ncbi:uncharacterized protein MELLADRAFT_95135 [Melampsora larici-populina 98AG31]|uniref:Uncharacterized protein n=1 Tax=Melampsora larici-populina (strain 98AG31 / pathotype 3-4-7) TaxID=747676 RepID=F4RC89_MELLP|nr:uncharacterized protein MELLADRAFT_95135 [Melampsora larici-populina 98AG31]EGG09993.1 hypothetical protein MELLADRAFT_95135 [Melampsora larici-populina 98AG31]
MLWASDVLCHLCPLPLSATLVTQQHRGNSSSGPSAAKSRKVAALKTPEPQPKLPRNAKRRGELSRVASGSSDYQTPSRRCSPIAQATKYPSPPPVYTPNPATLAANVNVLFSKVANDIVEYSRQPTSIPVMVEDDSDPFYEFFSTPFEHPPPNQPLKAPLVDYVTEAWDTAFPPARFHREFLRSGMNAYQLLFSWFAGVRRDPCWTTSDTMAMMHRYEAILKLLKLSVVPFAIVQPEIRRSPTPPLGPAPPAPTPASPPPLDPIIDLEEPPVNEPLAEDPAPILNPIPASLEEVLSEIETIAQLPPSIPAGEPDADELWDQVDPYLNARIGRDVRPQTLRRGRYGIDWLFWHWLVQARTLRGWDNACDGPLQVKLQGALTLLKEAVLPGTPEHRNAPNPASHEETVNDHYEDSVPGNPTETACKEDTGIDADEVPVEANPSGSNADSPNPAPDEDTVNDPNEEPVQGNPTETPLQKTPETVVCIEQEGTGKVPGKEGNPTQTTSQKTPTVERSNVGSMIPSGKEPSGNTPSAPPAPPLEPRIPSIPLVIPTPGPLIPPSELRISAIPQAVPTPVPPIPAGVPGLSNSLGNQLQPQTCSTPTRVESQVSSTPIPNPPLTNSQPNPTRRPCSTPSRVESQVPSTPIPNSARLSQTLP